MTVMEFYTATRGYLTIQVPDYQKEDGEVVSAKAYDVPMGWTLQIDPTEGNNAQYVTRLLDNDLMRPAVAADFLAHANGLKALNREVPAWLAAKVPAAVKAVKAAEIKAKGTLPEDVDREEPVDAPAPKVENSGFDSSSFLRGRRQRKLG